MVRREIGIEETVMVQHVTTTARSLEQILSFLNRSAIKTKQDLLETFLMQSGFTRLD
jgi:hypothetical protein